MYIPAHFAPGAQDNIVAFMQANPFVSLVYSGKHGLDTCAIPMLVVEQADGLRLHGHIARKNPVCHYHGGAVLALFNGANHYISPSWYPHKADDPKVVPTWNFQQVQARCELQVHDNSDWVMTNIARLTAHFEAQVGGSWQINDAPDAFIQKLLPAIIGVELVVESVEAKFKLSQNQPRPTREQLTRELQSRNSPLAVAMAESLRH